METGMLNENPNNLNWKNKLEDAGGLPEEILADKNATWEKLHNRLVPKPRRKRIVWYWAAAACILITIIIPLLKADKKHDSVVKKASPQAIPKKGFVKKVVPLQEEKIMAIAAKEIKKTVTLTQDVHLKSEVLLSKDILQKPAIVSPKLNTQNNIPPVPLMEQMPVQEMPVANVIALLGNTKKLKVVHINELGDPIPETHSKQRITDYRPIQIRLINQEVYSTALPSINNPGFNIFKTGNAPSN